MSGQTPIKLWELSDFGGINLEIDDRKINPGEFTILKNANTDEKAIKADAVDSLVNMPVPNVLLNTSWVYQGEGAAVISGASPGYTWAVKLTGAGVASGESIGILTPLWLSAVAPTSVTAINPFTAHLYSDNSASNIPGPYIDLLSAINNRIAVITNINSADILSGDPYYMSGVSWLGKDIIAGTAASAPIWVSLFGSSGYGAGTATAGITMACATAGTAWASYSSTPWSCIITKNSFAGGHVLNIIPFVTQGGNKSSDKVFHYSTMSAYIDKNAYSTEFDQTPFMLTRIYCSSEPNYKSSYMINGGYPSAVGSLSARYGLNTITEITASGYGTVGNFSINAFRDYNFVETSDNIGCVTNPENRNGLIIDKVSSPSYYLNADLVKTYRKRSAAYFNGYLVPARIGQVMAYKYSDSLYGSSKDIAIYVTRIDTAPFTNPQGVVAYNNYLMFYNVERGPFTYAHRMYWSEAGMINAFSTNQYENLSDGKAILHIEEWFGSLIIFFSDHIKRYNGVPGNATLETILYKGVSCAEMVCKMSGGIFFISSDGLYLYNGAFTKIKDLSKTFDQADQRKASEDGWINYNEERQELMFYPGYLGQINIFNTNNNSFRTLDYPAASASGGIRMFNYSHNYDLKTAISYPGITHPSLMFGGTTYKAMEVKSGWIDVDPTHEKKRFDRVIVEYKGQSSTAISQVNSITGTPTVTNEVLRFLGVGPSYVYGTISGLGVTGNSYRREMYYRWRTHYGKEYVFVGSQTTGDIPTPYHDGVPGIGSADLDTAINGYLAAAYPSPTVNDCVLMGPIEAADAFVDMPLSTFKANITSIINKISAHSALIKIFVVTGPQIPNYLYGGTKPINIAPYAEKAIEAYQEALAAGKNVYLINVNSQSIHIPVSTDPAGGDALHPDWLGYEQMGEYMVDQIASQLNISEYDNSVWLQDNFTDTSSTLLKNHTADINYTGDVWHDVNDRFDITDNNALFISLSEGKDTSIDLNQVVWSGSIKLYQTASSAQYFMLKMKSDDSKYLYFFMNSSTSRLYIYSDTGVYDFATFTSSLSTWYTFNITIRGNSITIKDVNDTVILHSPLLSPYNNYTKVGLGGYPIGVNKADNLLVTKMLAPTEKTIGVNINGTVLGWIVNADLYMDEEYEELYNLINSSREPVTCSYINPADYADGVYITADTAGTPFTLTLTNADGTLAAATATANNIGDYFDFTTYFDDNTSSAVTGIPLSNNGIVSYHIPVDRQANLIKYAISAPAQSTQVQINKLKVFYDSTIHR